MVIEMLIDLNELNNKDYIDFNYEVIKDDNLDKRIKDLKDATVEGFVKMNPNGIVELECIFKGKMMIEDSISLDIIPYDFCIKISDNMDELMNNYDNCYDNIQNALDLKTILWQNIVLEVPISYTKVNDAKLKGEGWELVDEKKSSDEIDPRLKKLEELLERR
jgi:uncharacterized metal-binding protein YceD (DUF177 family)